MGTLVTDIVSNSRPYPKNRTMRSLLPLILLSLLAYISRAEGSAHEFGFGSSSDQRVTEPEVVDEDDDDHNDQHMEPMEPSKGGGGSKYEYYGNYKSGGYKKKYGKKKYGGYKKKYGGYKKYDDYGYKRYDDYGYKKYEPEYGYKMYEPEYGYKKYDDYGYGGEYEPEYGYKN